MAGSGKPHLLEKTEPMCCPNTHLKELNVFFFFSKKKKKKKKINFFFFFKKKKKKKIQNLYLVHFCPNVG